VCNKELISIFTWVSSFRAMQYTCMKFYTLVARWKLKKYYMHVFNKRQFELCSARLSEGLAV
jgi:hypothetical protein